MHIRRIQSLPNTKENSESINQTRTVNLATLELAKEKQVLNIK
jgi:hypothetical protein